MFGRTIRTQLMMRAVCRSTGSSSWLYYTSRRSISSPHPADRLTQLKRSMEQGPSLDDFTAGITPAEIDELRQSNQRHNRARANTKNNSITKRLPSWLKAVPTQGANYQRMKETVDALGLSTVCEEARCPNIGECWGGTSSASASGETMATATIMLMGDTCTRGCRFCAVKTSAAPPPLDPNEPDKVSSAIAQWGLGYVVLTSVDRDDIADGGATHIARTVELLKERRRELLVEVLTPDFSGNEDHVAVVARSGLDVYAHNIETVESLQRHVRDHRAGYRQSLGVLECAKAACSSDLLTKSSIMVGCGETDVEIRQALADLRNSGVDIVTFGQYLRPSKRHMKVMQYVTPQKFDEYAQLAKDAGFLYVASGPMVRSSYRAGELFLKNHLESKRRGEDNIAE